MGRGAVDQESAEREALAKAVQTSVLTTKGHTPKELRRAVEQRVAILSGRETGSVPAVPDELEPYIDKVARHAFKVTDEDIVALKEAGYSEDQILEITAAAAVGAQMGRLERGLGALRTYLDLTETRR